MFKSVYKINRKIESRILLFSIILVSSLNSSLGQEQLGLRLENHAGINAISINPANSFLTPHNWDLNIASGGFFFDNNYAYLINTNTFELLRNIKNIKIENNISNNVQKEYPPRTFLIDFYNKKKESYFTLSGNLSGPSFSIKINEHNSIGFVSAYRFYGNIQKIPEELSYYTYYNKPYFQAFSITSFNSGFMYWNEFGINYVNKSKGYETITLLGGTLKYLSGNGAIYFNNENTFQFQEMPNDSIAALNNLNLQYGYTNTDFKFYNFNFNHNGSGASIDLGATIIYGESIKNYKFRIGVSLLDLGFINFNKNSKNYSINVDSLTIIGLNDFKDINQLSQLDSASQILSKQIFDYPDATLVVDNFKMLLPLALSIQFNYSLSNLLYINGILIQRLISKGNSASRENLFAISPGIEHRWFSVSTPVIVYNWKEVRLGFSLRLAYLTIGSDNVFTLFSNHKRYSGSDFYLGLKLNPFPVKRSKNLNKNIKCYKF